MKGKLDEVWALLGGAQEALRSASTLSASEAQALVKLAARPVPDLAWLPSS